MLHAKAALELKPSEAGSSPKYVDAQTAWPVGQQSPIWHWHCLVTAKLTLAEMSRDDSIDALMQRLNALKGNQAEQHQSAATNIMSKQSDSPKL